MFGIGSDSATWVSKLCFDNPGRKSQEMYNELLSVVEKNEGNERKWEEIIKNEEEEGQVNAVKIETLDKKMKKKHQKFEEKLKKFKNSTKSQSKVEAEISRILAATEDILQTARTLDNIL